MDPDLPISIDYFVNAGKIPQDDQTWLSDRSSSGGRIIGEICHFVDLVSFLIGKKITYSEVSRSSLKNDNVSIILSFEDNSVASINYFIDGNNRFPKSKSE